MADELEVLEKQQLSAQRSLHDLTDQLTLADHLVYKKYLTELQNYGMVELSQKMLEVQDPTQCIRMFQLKKLTLKKGEDMFQKLSTVYYSSMAQGCSLAVMIDVPEGNAGANIYLGVREDPLKQSMKSRKLEISSKALQKVLLSNFPGSDIKGISQKDEKELLDEAFGEAQEAVASVSCVAALRDKSKTEDKAFVQGIERFMDAMEGEKYTALFLAEPVSNETQAAIRSGYENLYSTLSPFRKSTWSYTENQSTAVMESLCSGTSHTISDTVSTTTTDGTNQSSSVTDGTQKTKGVSGGINGGVGSSRGVGLAGAGAGRQREEHDKSQKHCDDLFHSFSSVDLDFAPAARAAGIIYNNTGRVITERVRQRLPLLAAIGLAVGLGARLPRADEAQDDDCRHVGDHLEELIGDGDAGHLQTDLQRVAEAEEQAGKQNAACVPAAEDDGGQRDEAAARDHVQRPAGRVVHRHERAAEAAHEAGEADGDVLDLQHRHADRGGRVRVFAHRADVEAEARLIEHHARQRAAEESDPRQQIVAREDAAQKRDLADERKIDAWDE